jgi:hypothetical protein
MTAPAMPPAANAVKPPIKSDCIEPIGSVVNKLINAWLNTNGVPINTPTQHSAKSISVENAPVDALRRYPSVVGDDVRVELAILVSSQSCGNGPMPAFVA